MFYLIFVKDYNLSNYFAGLVNLVVGFLIVAGLKHYKISIEFILEMVIKKNVPHIVASTLFCFIILTVIYVTNKLEKQISESKNLNIFQIFGTSLNPWIYWYTICLIQILTFVHCEFWKKVSVLFHIFNMYHFSRFFAMAWLLWTPLKMNLIYIFMWLLDYKYFTS